MDGATIAKKQLVDVDIAYPNSVLQYIETFNLIFRRPEAAR